MENIVKVIIKDIPDRKYILEWVRRNMFLGLKESIEISKEDEINFNGECESLALDLFNSIPYGKATLIINITQDRTYMGGDCF